MNDWSNPDKPTLVQTVQFKSGEKVVTRSSLQRQKKELNRCCHLAVMEAVTAMAVAPHIGDADLVHLTNMLPSRR